MYDCGRWCGACKRVGSRRGSCSGVAGGSGRDEYVALSLAICRTGKGAARCERAVRGLKGEGDVERRREIWYGRCIVGLD